MSGQGSGCLSGLPTGTSPPSFWCSRSCSWTHTPGDLNLGGESQRFQTRLVVRVTARIATFTVFVCVFTLLLFMDGFYRPGGW